MRKDSKILLVEDSTKKLEDIKHRVAKYTKTIIASKSGSEAIKVIEDDKPDLIIINLSLKDISGFELTRLIKRNYHVPVITLTDNYQVAPCIRAHQEGADACIAYPFKKQDLETTIQKLI